MCNRGNRQVIWYSYFEEDILENDEVWKENLKAVREMFQKSASVGNSRCWRFLCKVKEQLSIAVL